MPKYDIAMDGENFTNGYNHDIVIIKRSKLKWGEPYQNGLLLTFKDNKNSCNIWRQIPLVTMLIF